MFRQRPLPARWLTPALLVLGLGAVLAIGSLAGCAASTGLTNMWRDPDYNAPPIQDMLVLSMRRVLVMRRLWEDEFVEELAEHDIQATASYRLFPEQIPDTSAVLAAVRDNGFDGVLINYPAGRETERRYVPGYVTSRPVTSRSPWTGYYYTRWRNTYEPGYVTEDQLVYNDIQLWDARDEGNILVWAGTTETVNPTSTKEVSHEISEEIIPEMVKQGVIGR